DYYARKQFITEPTYNELLMYAEQAGVSEFDKEATDAKKDEIVAQRQSDAYVTACEEWMAEASIEVNEDVWAKVDFKELTVNIKVEETEEAEETAE
ncbi:MAG: hypothetical protein U0M60_04275, partial [Clostridia bacterium]|nr:hypothetical protein [Clostridia bacterium]